MYTQSFSVADAPGQKPAAPTLSTENPEEINSALRLFIKGIFQRCGY
mgnify:CR=1 FL=1